MFIKLFYNPEEVHIGPYKLDPKAYKVTSLWKNDIYEEGSFLGSSVCLIDRNSSSTSSFLLNLQKSASKV